MWRRNALFLGLALGLVFLLSCSSVRYAPGRPPAGCRPADHHTCRQPAPVLVVAAQAWHMISATPVELHLRFPTYHGGLSDLPHSITLQCQ